MRLFPWLVLAVVAGCYSGHAAPGSPCTPALDNCPHNQSCALVSGSYICLEGEVSDAALDVDAALVDAPPPMLDAGLDAAPATPWSLVDSKGEMGAASISINATGAGHLLVLGIETLQTNTVTSIADDAGNVYVAVPNRAVNTSFNVGLELWYAVNSKAGATTITVTASTVKSIVMWEFANIKTTSPLDTSTKVDNQATSTTPLGAAITTTQARELVIATVVVQNNISGIHAGSLFSNDHLTLGNGWAHLTTNNAPAGTYQAQWDQSSTGPSCAASAAFLIGP